MKTINWNQASDLGLMERINRQILHPLGLAMYREVETGASPALMVSDDGEWRYHPDMETTILPDEKVISLLREMESTPNMYISIPAIPETRLIQGWKHLCKLYKSEYKHCLRYGCSKETLAYWANKLWGFGPESPWFYREVLREAVRREWAIESKNEYGCRAYKFHA